MRLSPSFLLSFFFPSFLPSACRLIEIEALRKAGTLPAALAASAKLDILGLATIPRSRRATGAEYIPLDSMAGQKLLAECTNPAHAARVMDVFEKQETDTSCGICSSAVAIRSVANTPSAAKLLSSQMMEVFTKLPRTNSVLSIETVIDEGMTLQQVAAVLDTNCGGEVVCVHADDTSRDQFASDVRKALDTPHCMIVDGDSDGRERIVNGACVLINYDMATLATTTGSREYTAGLPPAERVASGLGHLSVLAAWHKGSGRFLLLDTWPGTPSGWVSVEDMFNAMDTFDVTSRRKRGYVVLWHQAKHQPKAIV
eukprot:SAG31_NODE_3492_length_4201_cov_3.139444_4_plen_313_part_00